jgi:queuine/archaeosine tRNA-ribosyltransferase
MADEMLGPTLLSIHNIRHFQRLMVDIRAILRHDAWLDLEVRWPVLRATGNSEDKRDDATATQSLG